MAKLDSFSIIPKQKLDVPKWVNPTIGACVGLVLVMVGLFFYFSFLATSWEKKSDAQEIEYASINTPENKAIEKRISEISNQLEKFSEVFAIKKTSSVIFDFLREVCHPNVSFSSLLLDLNASEVSLIGETDTYKSLSEQAIILKEIKEISNLNIGDISLSKEGQVSFRVSFVLDQAFFKNQ